MRQRAVSRPVETGKEAFYLRIPLVAAQDGAPYDAPLFIRSLTDIVPGITPER
jgi:hypothetical protein